MIVFLLGFLVVSILAAAGALVTDAVRGEALAADEQVWIVVVLGLLPLVGAALVVSMIDWWRPRRFLGRCRGFGCARFARGAIAGSITVLFYTAALPFLDTFAPSELFVGAAAALATTIVLLPAERIRPRECRRCGYDLSESLDRDRCPECAEPFGVASAIRTGEPTQSDLCSSGGVEAGARGYRGVKSGR